MLSSEARIRLGQAGPVAKRLRDWVATHPQDPTAWQLRADAYKAEAQVALLDYAAALDRFKAAQDLVRRRTLAGQPVDHIEASIIDARLRDVQLLLKEQALQG